MRYMNEFKFSIRKPIRKLPNINDKVSVCANDQICWNGQGKSKFDLFFHNYCPNSDLRCTFVLSPSTPWGEVIKVEPNPATLFVLPDGFAPEPEA